MLLPSTFGDLVEQRAASQGPAMAYGLLDETADVRVRVSYEQLHADAARLADRLTRRFERRSRILIAYPNGIEFVVSLVGCVLAGMIAVPVAAPRRNRENERFKAIVRDARPSAMLTVGAWRTVVRDEIQAAGDEAVEVYATDGEAPDDIPARRRRGRNWRAAPDDIVYLQYTSGSITQPKGVLITHRNLLSNAAVAWHVEENDETSVSLTWLPNFHDMGLVEGLFQPLFSGVPGLIMMPSAFLQRPRLWLEGITRHRVTNSGAPNFAYQLCVEKAGVHDGSPLDLSTWRVAYNGAEPIRDDTLRRFLETFGPCGFQERAFYPVYGLAEGTLVVTSDGRQDVPRRLTVDRARLERGTAVPAAEGAPGGCTLVASGAVLSRSLALGTDVVIVNPADAEPRPAGTIGEVLLAGPSVAAGYWHRPDETAATFAVCVPGRPETRFLRTGDLGFLHEGRLFLTGRLKDVIITKGRNLYPHDIEWLAASADPRVRPWHCAAFALREPDDRIVIVCEAPRRAAAGELRTLAGTMRARVSTELDIDLHDLLFIPPGMLPKTSSGKTRRLTCRDMVEQGALTVRFSLRQAEGPAAAPPPADADAEADERARAIARVCDELRALLASGRGPVRIADDAPLCEYVGDSLQAVKLCHELERRHGVVVPVSHLLDRSSLASLAARLLSSRPEARAGAAPPEEPRIAEASHVPDGLLPLSHEQEALWFLATLAPESVAYHICRALEIRGRLNVSAFRRALDLLVARHAALRTRLVLVDGVPYQAFDSSRTVSCEIEAIPAGEGADDAVRRRMEALAWQPFALDRDSLVRLHLLRQDDERHLLVLSIHHIVADLWSVALLLDELFTQYEALESGRWHPAVPAGLDYADVVRLRRQLPASAEGRRQRDYWQAQLRGLPAETALPGDRPRPPAQTFEGALLEHDLDAALTAEVDRCARQLGVTAFCAMLATYLVFLHRASGQATVTVGVPASGRGRAATAETVGFLATVRVIRADLSASTTWRDLVARTQTQLLAAMEADEYPLPLMVDDAGLARDPRLSPLFQQMFSLETPPRLDALAPFVGGRSGGGLVRAGLALSSVALPQRGAQVDLHARFIRHDQRLLGNWTYNTDLFEAATVRRWAEAYAQLLRAACRAPETPVAALAVDRPDDGAVPQGLVGARGALAADDATLFALVARQARETPDRIALSFGDQAVTYAQLARRARLIGRALRQRGAGPETCVAVCLERSLDLPLALLGVLASGAAYLPMGTDWPRRRADQVLAAARPVLILTGDARAALVAPGAIPLSSLVARGPDGGIASVPPRVPLGDGAASVLFTSGSTGEPKGAINTHRGLVNRLCWMQQAYALTAGDRVLQKTPYTFDVSAWELFWPLLAGAQLVMAAPGVHRDPGALARTIAEREATVLHFVPSMLEIFTQQAPAAALGSVRLVICSGEALSKAVEAEALRLFGGELHNLYGPTEAAIDVTAWRCRPGDRGASVPLGHPIANITLRLLDAGRRAVIPRAAGELCLAGVGLARGYVGRPDLTAAAFQPDPYDAAGGGRLYHTGDWARQRSDLAIEFLGRRDDQVKVRGVRIELQEIEALLHAHPALAGAAVVARDADGRGLRLIAYYVTRTADGLDVRALRHWLAERLPDAMLPAAFVALPALPHLDSGKIDRQALLARAIDLPSAPAHPPSAPPRTAEERILAEIWEEVLGVSVGVTDTFFDLGGDSLLILRAAAKARARGLPITAERVYHRQTIARICADLPAADEATLSSGDEAPYRPFSLVDPADRDRLPGDLDDALPLARLQESMVYHIDHSENYIAYVASAHLCAAVHLDLWERAVDEAMARHAYLRTSFVFAGLREPLQLVHRRVPSPLHVEDIRHLSATEQDRYLTQWMAAEKKRRFAWDVPPLFRLTLHRRTEETCQLTLTEVTLDGWSIAVLLSELCRTYEALLRGGAPPAPPTIEPAYGRFVRAERQAREDAAHQARWRRPETLEAAGALPRWPAAWRTTDRSLHNRRTIQVREDIDRLQACAREAGCPLKSVFLAAHLGVLRTLTGRDDVLTSLITHGRPEVPGSDMAVGLYTNTVPLQAGLRGLRWIDLARHAHRAELALYPYRRYPFADIARHWAHPLLMATAFNFTHFHVYEDLLQSGRDVRALDVLAFDQTYFALTAYFNLLPATHGLTIDLDYNPTEFASEQVTLIAGYYERALQALARAPGTAIADTHLLSAPEAARELETWSGRATTAAPPRDLVEAIAVRCRQAPDRVAIVHDGAAITYGTLWRRAAALRARLVAFGVGPEIGVGVRVDRSPDTVVALVAVLGCGAFFVPLDPCDPPERRAQVMRDAGLRVLIADDAAADAAAATNDAPYEAIDGAATTDATAGGRAADGAVRADAADGRRAGLHVAWVQAADAGRPARQPGAPAHRTPPPQTLAYCMYTSGATGLPKGVEVPRAALASFVPAAVAAYGIAPDDRILQFASLSFDASLEEIFCALSTGATLVLRAPGDLESFDAFLSACARHATTVLDLPTAFWHRLTAALAEDRRRTLPASVRTVILGGEKASAARLAEWRDAVGATVTVINSYGPTEATIVALQQAVDVPPPVDEDVPIGRPLAGVTAFVLGEDGRIGPVGLAGELGLGGSGLARGYRGRGDLTAERFRPNPHDAGGGGRLYLTGDLVRRRPDGAVDFVGRRDDQVKIRGFRIELAEIERLLLSDARVSEAAAIVWRPSGAPEAPVLLAFATPKAWRPDEPEQAAALADDLLARLARRLPPYMVPARIELLASLPATQAGKVDKARLGPSTAYVGARATIELPRGPIEAAICAIYEATLGLDAVSRTSRFTQAGGDSLSAMRIAGRLQERLGVRVTVRDLFDAPSIAVLADRLSRARRPDALDAALDAPIRPAPPGARLEMSDAQERLWFLHQFDRAGTSYNVPALFRLRGDLNRVALHQAFQTICRRHQVLRTRFVDRGASAEPVLVDAVALPLACVDLRSLAPDARDAQAAAIATGESVRRFDLTAAPLMRLTLVHLAEGEWLLVVVMHHIVTDEWCAEIFMREFRCCYDAALRGAPARLPDLPIQYTDHARWSKATLSGPRLEALRQFWRRELADAPPVIRLPLDVPRERAAGNHGARHAFEIAPDVARGLRAIGRAHDASLFMVLLSAYQIWLHGLTGMDDIIVGSPITGRSRPETEPLVGFFANLLVLRGRMRPDQDFGAHLAATRETALTCYDHQALSFAQLVSCLNPERSSLHAPLVQVIFGLWPQTVEEMHVDGLDVRQERLFAQQAKYDLEMQIAESGDRLRGFLEYNAALFTAETIAELVAGYHRLCGAIVERPAAPVASLRTVIRPAEMLKAP